MPSPLSDPTLLLTDRNYRLLFWLESTQVACYQFFADRIHHEA